MEVTSQVPLLQTQGATVGQVIGASGREYVVERPGLDHACHADAGSDPTPAGRSSRQPVRRKWYPSCPERLPARWRRNNSNDVDFLSGEADVVKPPVDAIAEFQIQTNNFCCRVRACRRGNRERNREVGYQRLPWAVWEFFRNDALDANDYFSNPATQRKPELRRNQFGGAVGGHLQRQALLVRRLRRNADSSGYAAEWHLGSDRPEASSGFTNYADLIGATGTLHAQTAGAFQNGQLFDPATTRAVTAGG